MDKQAFLAANPQTREFFLLEAIQNGMARNEPSSISAAGAAYSLTNTAAALDFGTTDPVLVIAQPGTYLLLAQAQLDAAAATITTQTASLKLRRTNNTAADIGDVLTIDLLVMTTLTHTLGVFPIAPVTYTTTNSTDSLTIFGGLSATAGAGNINAVSARIQAIRLY